MLKMLFTLVIKQHQIDVGDSWFKVHFIVYFILGLWYFGKQTVVMLSCCYYAVERIEIECNK